MTRRPEAEAGASVSAWAARSTLAGLGGAARSTLAGLGGAARSTLAGLGGAARSTLAGLAVLVWAALPAVVAAASPAPSQAGSTDTRSALEGPGFVGSPGTAILIVAGIALLAVVVTTLYVRLSQPAGSPSDRR